MGVTWGELFARLGRVLWAISLQKARAAHASHRRVQHEHFGTCDSCRHERTGVQRYFAHCPYSTKEQMRNVNANRRMIGLAPEEETSI